MGITNKYVIITINKLLSKPMYTTELVAHNNNNGHDSLYNFEKGAYRLFELLVFIIWQ